MPKHGSYRAGGEDYMIPASPCPCCGARLDGATRVDGPGLRKGIPEPGALTVCLLCGEILVIGVGLVLAKPTAAQRAAAERNGVWALLEQMARTAMRLDRSRANGPSPRAMMRGTIPTINLVSRGRT